MWEHFQEGVKPHADIAPPAPAKDLAQKWFDPQWRAEYLDWYVAHSSLMADMLPVANTQLGPGSLAAILGGVFEGGEDTIWIHPDPDFNDEIVFNPEHPNWILHKELLKACKAKANGNYFVGMPDLMEGLDVLAALKGTDTVSYTHLNFMNSIVSDDVYMRWTQFGVFTSHIRYHGTNKREPWHYPAIAPLVKQWWKLRYSLIPYILEQSKLAIESGSPLLQALILHHPEDKICWHIDDEYYFGNEFLVAPVMNSENRRDVYLPEGQWVNFFTGERLQGGCWLKDIYVPLEEMPVYVRENAVIPIYPEEVDCTDEMDLSKSVVLHIDQDYNCLLYTSRCV